mmetsp:Transcript_70762/g.178410  ORF Transcript_70762/g.178410 Transcript_70762/m.178410 type:complete len:229 (+) Transcript_70762:351-1037(+)
MGSTCASWPTARPAAARPTPCLGPSRPGRTRALLLGRSTCWRDCCRKEVDLLGFPSTSVFWRCITTSCTTSWIARRSCQSNGPRKRIASQWGSREGIAKRTKWRSRCTRGLERALQRERSARLSSTRARVGAMASCFCTSVGVLVPRARRAEAACWPPRASPCDQQQARRREFTSWISRVASARGSTPWTKISSKRASTSTSVCPPWAGSWVLSRQASASTCRTETPP